MVTTLTCFKGDSEQNILSARSPAHGRRALQKGKVATWGGTQTHQHLGRAGLGYLAWCAGLAAVGFLKDRCVLPLMAGMEALMDAGGMQGAHARWRLFLVRVVVDTWVGCVVES